MRTRLIIAAIGVIAIVWPYVLDHGTLSCKIAPTCTQGVHAMAMVTFFSIFVGCLLVSGAIFGRVNKKNGKPRIFTPVFIGIFAMMIIYGLYFAIAYGNTYAL